MSIENSNLELLNPMQENWIIGRGQKCLYNVQADPGLHTALCWSWSPVFAKSAVAFYQGKIRKYQYQFSHSQVF